MSDNVQTPRPNIITETSFGEEDDSLKSLGKLSRKMIGKKME